MIRLCRCAYAVASAGTRAAAPPSTRSCAAAIIAVDAWSCSTIVSAAAAVDAVHEHRARGRDRVELLVAAALEDRRIRLRPDHVGQRLRERAERGDGALAGLDLARVDEQRRR